ncbi:MAG: BNR-4 repeat-containing protein [Rariglobus sp.]
MSSIPASASFVHDSKLAEASTAAGLSWWQQRPAGSAEATGEIVPAVQAAGYRGIWFALGFKFEHGDKYSGGLGTYTANHHPMAVYAPAVNKTFFTYGGAPSADRRELVIVVSYYDHTRHEVPRPVALYADPSVDDPHDNASLQIDEAGYIWVFKSGRGTRRPGIIFRSTKPYDIAAFEQVSLTEFTYPQPWTGVGDKGFFMLFTKYFKGTDYGPERRLFWKTSADGRVWSEDHALAAFGGHYQTSGRWSGNGVTKYATFFNYHPESHVDRRTNLYYTQTTDGGKTWTNAAGKALDLPLSDRDNAALVLDLQAEGKFMYSCDLNFDPRGNPILLCIVSRAGEPGPAGDPREWTVLHWKGEKWARHVVAVSDHNYDMGSLYVEGSEWRIIGPTAIGPQKWGTGGEMETWTSHDEGRTWKRERVLTAGSEFNHSYARRPLNAHPDFAAFWADGNPNTLTPSRLYFSNTDGSRVWQLPYDMEGDFATPLPVVASPAAK